MKKLFFPAVLALAALSGCVGAGWDNVYEQHDGKKIVLDGYINGSANYPAEIFTEGEIRGYLWKDQKKEVGLPLLLEKETSCPTKKVRVHGEVKKRQVTRVRGTLGTINWIIIKADKVECLQ